MSRRKQARPTKRVLEEDEDCPSEAKCVKLDEPSTSNDYRGYLPPSPSASPSAAPSANPLLLLENSIKKFDPTRSSASTASNKPASGLGALYNFVGSMGGPAHQGHREEGVASILKCLQCGKGFPAMDHLVRHMQETKHFNNLPKTYSHFMQLERQKVLNLKMQSKTETFQLACLKCGEVPGNMDKHLRETHDIKGTSEWLRHVQVIPGSTTPPQLNQIMSLISAMAKK